MNRMQYPKFNIAGEMAQTMDGATPLKQLN